MIHRTISASLSVIMALNIVAESVLEKDPTTPDFPEDGIDYELDTDEDGLSNLLSYNHHDYLSACGDAKKWLIEMCTKKCNDG